MSHKWIADVPNRTREFQRSPTARLPKTTMIELKTLKGPRPFVFPFFVDCDKTYHHYHIINWFSKFAKQVWVFGEGWEFPHLYTHRYRYYIINKRARRGPNPSTFVRKHAAITSPNRLKSLKLFFSAFFPCHGKVVPRNVLNSTSNFLVAFQYRLHSFILPS